MPSRLTQALEQDLDFETMRSYAKDCGVSGSWFVAFLNHTASHLFGRPSIYDYAARVRMAENLLGHVKPEHKKAARLALERILFNLAPNPDALAAATDGVDALPRQNTGITMPFKPLDDTGHENKPVVPLRYKLLRRSFLLYCDVGIKALEGDMAEEAEPDFPAVYAARIAELREPAKRLRELRAQLYERFPEGDLYSVASDVIRHRNACPIREELDATSRGKRMLDELVQLEGILHKELDDLLTQGRNAMLEWTKLRQHYQRALQNLELLKCAVAPSLAQESLEEVDAKLKAFENAIGKRFRAERYVPPEILQDISADAKLHLRGDLKGQV